LKANNLQYEFDNYKKEVSKQIKKHKQQKIWWSLVGVATGVLIGHFS